MIKEIHIGLAFDNNYLPYFYVTLQSIFENKTKDSILNFHIISPDLTEETKKRIQNEYDSSQIKFNFYEINESNISHFVTSGEWSLAVYYRLFFPLFVPENVKRLIYLDTDIVVLKPLDDFFVTNLNGFPIGAVYDNYVKKQALIDIEEGNYFNSGVLLIDIEKWNTQEISEKTFSFLNNNPDKIKFVDQCALNFVLKNNWRSLDNKFNLMYSYIPEALSKRALMDFMHNKIIVHFTLQRPWKMLCTNPLRFFYHKYRLKSNLLVDKSKYVDFSWKKIIPFLKIRLLEVYFNSAFFRTLVTKIKSIT